MKGPAESAGDTPGNRRVGGSENYRTYVVEALRLLGVKRFVIAIHDASFPSAPGDDTGRGTPCSAAGLELARFFRGHGFTGIQFGPQGMTPAHSPSPYESSLFSRDPLSISLSRLVEAGLLEQKTLAEAVRGRPGPGARRVPYGYAYRSHRAALQRAFRNFDHRRGRDRTLASLEEGLRIFAAREAPWLERDALYDLLQSRYGTADWRRWRGPTAPLDRQLASPDQEAREACRDRRRKLQAECRKHFERYRFVQYLAHRQHGRFKDASNAMGLHLYGDLQVGFSDGDAWGCRGLFLPRYRLGAPPSRTNPEGQPWGYGVLNPALYRDGHGPGPVEDLLEERTKKMFREFDGLRIDHPHGLVCPWVYRDDLPDPYHAVREGARLFSSPALPDHPDLAPFAIPSPGQIDEAPGVPRYADDRVRELTSRQVERYAKLFDVIVAAALRAGRSVSDLIPEVLSTLPCPLRRVLLTHGLGRFRVTQKADLAREDDVYRSENASVEDWIMVGTHDTKPIWLLLDHWERSGLMGERAAYLAARLTVRGGDREALRRRLAESPPLVAQAHFADLFASPASNVMVFFTDFFGMKETFNRPGFVSAENWSLRLPPDYRGAYDRGLRKNAVCNVPLVLALALGSREGEGPRALGKKLLRLVPSLPG